MLTQTAAHANQPNLIPLHGKERHIHVIRTIRQEWESLVEGQSLVDVQGSVGLLLADFAHQLELNRAEQTVALGEELTNELTALDIL